MFDKNLSAMFKVMISILGDFANQSCSYPGKNRKKWDIFLEQGWREIGLTEL